MQQTDEPQTIAEAFATYASDCPCDGCRNADLCSVGLACGEYVLWVCATDCYIPRNVPNDREPSSALYRKLFGKRSLT
ncbi:hypothetical protein [Bradyrhizobium elkanii]|uniref:hypothetical protein n=1 Tax=Bradyrhizobium elkanii TaxID=29448 RepID=UPI00035F099C|nr:hypothetical protein [Bradyrhizobium elkanii]MBP2434763.1 hypothetical protein [Bradyrhizobium elkanii]MCP1732001.1 hypothetical protein [Bradyrhizobium elkanii]MCS3567335.1 hypothetical protein [Bradyrhizobium elkanii]MCS3591180.1 hypothetical protein [Bradyrhizobium elkanii]MCS3620623.1 hypothetical protein [Bradyrhizobium elkanii]